MKTGIKLNVTKPIRSSKTGMFLPREGTLVSVTENLGRTLLLVEFEDGQREYLFEGEVEFETGNPCSLQDQVEQLDLVDEVFRRNLTSINVIAANQM